MKTQFSHLSQTFLTTGVVAVCAVAGAFIMMLLTGINATGAPYAPPSGQDLSSDNIRRIPIESFEGISLTTAVSMEITQGEFPGYVEIIGQDTPEEGIDVYVEAGELKASYNSNGKGVAYPVSLRATIPNLTSIRTSGAASLTVSGALHIDGDLKVEASNASDVNFGEISCNTLTVTASTASKVYALITEASSVKIEASTAADVKLRGIDASNISTLASTAAEVILSGRCNDSNVKCSTGGEVVTRGLILDTSFGIAGATSSPNATQTNLRVP